ncbi:hypothetical protein KIN20_037923 [Parelaphostrongylus tenuis]|uniref:Uncharacterized protein n=1 Tax=Parelaphostrongylus tenuis TaxID=148309 RepID=A0AAD5RE73_PARTN|nr:hypothetical protein KIN20_037923 [Parelaphostrongylus tenuis]
MRRANKNEVRRQLKGKGTAALGTLDRVGISDLAHLVVVDAAEKSYPVEKK